MDNQRKINKRVELGHLALVTTNQYNLIVDFKMMEGEKDAAQVKPLIDRLCQRYPNQIESISFDKGFYSKENFEYVLNAGIPQVVMPQKAKNVQEAEYENTKYSKKYATNIPQSRAASTCSNITEPTAAPIKDIKTFANILPSVYLPPTYI